MIPWRPTRRLMGSTLIETLIAILVLSIGVLALSRIESQLRLHSDIARQRSEAVRLGQEDMEQLRAFSVITTASGNARSYAEIVSTYRTVDSATGYVSNTSYTLIRQVGDAGVPQARNVLVTVSWTDRAGHAQQIVLGSMISSSDPAHSSALGLMPGASSSTRGANVRSISIPSVARNLGNGTSAFQPGHGSSSSSDGSSVAFVFNNASGLITARCHVDPKASTTDLQLADLTQCMTATAYLLSGVVRFTSDSPPHAAKANDAPLATTLALTLTGGRYLTPPYCTSEAIVTRAGDRHLAYRCAVYPLASGLWSGRTSVTPSSGWTLGAGPANHRVCRYSADLDGSGSVDTPREHPASYIDVDRSLANQNFLIIPGNEICPDTTLEASTATEHRPTA